jgi:hypothetical protein
MELEGFFPILNHWRIFAMRLPIERVYAVRQGHGGWGRLSCSSGRHPSTPRRARSDQERAELWLDELAGLLQRLGGVRLVPPNETSPVPGVLEYGRPFVLAPSPA